MKGGSVGDKGQLYKRSDLVSERKIDDEMILVDSETDTIFHLNALGVGIWNLLQTPISIEEIVTTFCSAFPDDNTEQISRDVRKILNEMESRNIILSE